MPECDHCGATHATVERTLDGTLLCPGCQAFREEQERTRDAGQRALDEVDSS